MNNLYILTLTWNAEDKLSKLKESLLPNLDNINFNWLIKDNASKDKTVEIASTWGNNIKVIPYKDNLQNFSEGMNYLYKEASPQDNDYILLLNNDVIFNDKYSIKNMMSIMQNDSNVGVVGARLLYTNTNKLQHAGVVFHDTVRTPTHFREGQISDKNAEKNREFQAVTGAVWLTKSEYFKNICTTNKSGINGFNEKLIWCFDDIDACLAVKYRMQKKIIYCGKTNIFHEESASLKKNPVNKLFLAHNITYLKSTWGDIYSLDKNTYDKDSKYNLYKE